MAHSPLPKKVLDLKAGVQTRLANFTKEVPMERRYNYFTKEYDLVPIQKIPLKEPKQR